MFDPAALVISGVPVIACVVFLTQATTELIKAESAWKPWIAFSYALLLMSVAYLTPPLYAQVVFQAISTAAVAGLTVRYVKKGD